MTLIHDIEKNCPVCGKSSPQPVLTSTNTMGYPDLDLRPAEMQRSTMFVWLDECPHCGYVSPSFSDETDITEDFLKSDEYINCDGFEFKNDLSKRFYKAYLIAKKTKNSEECFFHLLHCAWKCDDAEDPLAAEMRRLALSYFDDLKYSDEKKKDYLCMKADLLRRTGQFDRLIEEFKNIIIGEEIYDKIINFQIEMAGKQDTSCYTVDDAINP